MRNEFDMIHGIKGLKPSERDFLSVLAWHKTMTSNGEIRPTFSTLAKWLDCSERYVSEIVSAMEEKGLISVERGDGRGYPTYYKLNLKDELRLTLTLKKGCTTVHPLGGKKDELQLHF